MCIFSNKLYLILSYLTLSRVEPGSDADTAKSPEIMKKNTRLIICMQFPATFSSSSEVNQLFLKTMFAKNELGKDVPDTAAITRIEGIFRSFQGLYELDINVYNLDN